MVQYGDLAEIVNLSPGFIVRLDQSVARPRWRQRGSGKLAPSFCLEVPVYLPAVTWIIGACLCSYIAKKRGVKITTVRMLFAVILGPLAIPFVFLLPATTKSSRLDSRN